VLESSPSIEVATSTRLLRLLINHLKVKDWL
jgi:hypothetical protein